MKYVSSRKGLWDEYLDLAYNTSRRESSLHTPFEVMRGRKAVIPIELTYLDPGSQLLSMQLHEVFRNGEHNGNVHVFLCKTISCIHFGICDHNPFLLD